MGKKKQDVVTESSTTIDLESSIHQHSVFFDKLVELIPAKFYLPNDDNDRPWFQGLSKAEKISAKKETKENIKKSRRDRLDPEKSSATTLDLLKQSLEKQKSNKGNVEEEEAKPFMSGLEGDEKSVTYEELRERLHRKLEEFRAGRNCVNPEKAKKRMERNDRKGTREKKRKRDDDGPEEKKPTTIELAKKVERDAEEASKGLMFTKVKLDEEKHTKKRMKMSKKKELEKAKKIAEAKKDPEKGESLTKELAWKAAMDRAAGKKVHDDPKLLAKSLKKEKKRRQKSALKWKERVQSTDKLKAEKQQRRSENIAERIREKKARRIAKREKKLLRPGFEGRKEGFVNDTTA